MSKQEYQEDEAVPMAKKLGVARNDGATPTLLGIPGELRNHIYRQTLVVYPYFDVNAAYHQEPSLLSVCRQITCGAQDVFCKENVFGTRVRDLRPELPQSGHWLRTRGVRIGQSIKVQASWKNLEEWLRAAHAGEIPYPPESIGKCKKRSGRLSIRAGNMVRKMQSMLWTDVESVLEDFRAAVNNTKDVFVD